MSRFETPRLDRAERVVAGRRWHHAGQDTDPVRARVVWERAGEELVDARATRWSGRAVFVTPTRGRSRSGALGVWLDSRDVVRL
jgi:hypothetical protein